MVVLKWTAKDSDKYSKICNSYVQLSGTPRFLQCGVTNYHKRLFLESWHSTLDSAAINERKPLPCFYLLLFQKINETATNYLLVVREVVR